MDKQILELLLKIDARLGRLENNVNELKKDMEDRFDIVDIKLNVIENKVTQVSRKLDVTTNQVARNMDTMENIKLKLQ